MKFLYSIELQYNPTAKQWKYENEKFWVHNSFMPQSLLYYSLVQNQLHVPW